MLCNPHLGVKLVERHAYVEAALWRRYYKHASQSTKDKLFDFYKEIALKISRGEFRMRPHYGLQFEDFKQLAFSGLLTSIDRFDPLRGIPFEVFARKRIKGAISDGVAVSSESAANYVHRKAQQSDRMNSLIDQDSSKPDNHIKRLGEVVIGLAIGLLLEDYCLDDLESSEPDPYASLELKDVQKSVLLQLAALPDPDGLILRHHYLDGLSFTSIADKLMLSKGRVSQIHRAALHLLKTRLQKPDWGPF